LRPAATAVNVNTASKEVLMAAIKGLDAGSAARLIQIRQRTPFLDIAKGMGTAFPNLDLQNANIGVDSAFFEVTGRLRLSDRVLTERSLVQRLPPPSRQINVLNRERIASLEQVGP
jgi:general secretion pathway protein K